MNVFKPSRRLAGKRVISAYYSGRYIIPGQQARRTVALHLRDKESALAKLRQIVTQAERELTGLAAPKALVDGAQKPLSAHLRDYLAELAAKGRDERYVYHVRKRNERLFRECRWSVARDVTAASFMSWRQQNAAKAPKTLNEYLDAVSSFFSWLVRFDCVERNPLARVGKVETKGRERRAFTVDEVRRLVAVAGPRRLAYLAAVFTGLRRAELTSLRVGDLHLAAETPFVLVRASTTKNGRSARLALHADLLAELHRCIPADAPASQPVLAEVPSVAELRQDEEAAGIPFLDELGRRADFHAFRHTFSTLLGQAGIPSQIAKHLTRHSSERMNAHYTDATKLPLADAICSLPSMLGDSPLDAQTSGAKGRGVASGVAEEENGDCNQPPISIGESRVLSPTDAKCQKTELAPEVGLEPFLESEYAISGRFQSISTIIHPNQTLLRQHFLLTVLLTPPQLAFTA